MPEDDDQRRLASDKVVGAWMVAGMIVLLGWAFGGLIFRHEDTVNGGGGPIDIFVVAVFVICWAIGGGLWLLNYIQRR